MRKAPNYLNNENGFALIMVLWVIIILMVIVMSFSVLAKTEVMAALFFQGVPGGEPSSPGQGLSGRSWRSIIGRRT